MAVEPTTKDKLKVLLTVTDDDGNEVVLKEARIAGDLTSDEINKNIEKINSINGTYTLSDLIIKENEVFDFGLRLEGEQNIEKGVYVYSPYGGRNSSQTLVGVAEGTNKVDVEMTADICFDVEERIIKTQHEWASTKSTVRPTEPETTKETTTAAQKETTTIAQETTTIPETTTRVYDDDDDNEPETTPRTTAPEITVPETTVPETSPAPTSPTVIYRGVEIPQSILDAYPDKTLDELFDMGVLGAFFENVPTGLLPATNDMSVIWTAMSVLSAVGLAGVSVIGKKREDEEE